MAIRTYNVPELIDLVRTLYKEPDDSAFTADIMLEFLNAAQTRAAEELGRLWQEETLLSTVASQQEIALPEAVQRVFAVWFYDGSDWLRLNYMAYHQQSSHYDEASSQPTSYYVRRNVLGLVPVPSANGSQNIKVDCTVWPDELTDSSTSYPFNNRAMLRPFHELLADYAVSLLAASDSKLDVADWWEQRFYRKLARAKKILRMRVQSDATAARTLRPFGRDTGGPFASNDLSGTQVGVQNDDMGTDFVP